jgi:hypothetical protein
MVANLSLPLLGAAAVTVIPGPRRWLMVCAAAILAPLIWAVNMQLGQILPYAQCGSRFRLLLWSSSIGVLQSLVAGIVSWRGSPAIRSAWFAARVSVLLGLVFAFTMVLQALAGLMLTGCER